MRKVKADSTAQKTFWEHLDELRTVIIRLLAVFLAAFIIAFCFRDLLFSVLLAPQHADFVTYRWIDSLLSLMAVTSDSVQSAGSISIPLINTELAQQFIIHMKAAACVGLIVISPYVLCECFHYISPALYRKERRYALLVVLGGYVMFLIGMLFSYYVIFPFTFRFLGTYQVDELVVNTITLDSYMSTLFAITLTMGIVFQMPVLSWLLGRLGIINRRLMRRYRRHVFIFILAVSAVITPTSDAFTLMLVSLPMYMLYEVSIMLVGRSGVKEVKGS